MALPGSREDREHQKFVVDASDDTNLRVKAGADDLPVTLDGEKVQITDGIVAGQARIDGATEALQIINYAQHEIHEGNHYYVEGYTTLGNGDELRVKLVTPDSAKWSHILWDIGSSGILTTQFYEGASGGMAGGSGVTPVNSNRNSGSTSGNTITSGVAAATSDGTLISSASWGSRTVGGGQTRESEVVLKQDTIYLRKFISGAASNILTFKATWYELTDIQ